MVGTIEHWRIGINSRGMKMYEGLMIGGTPTQQKLSEEHGRVCIECEEDKMAGVFSVGKSRNTFFKSTDFVNFTCKECIEYIYGDEYDWSKTKHE